MRDIKLIIIVCCVSMMVYNNYVAAAAEPNLNEISKKANENKPKGLDVLGNPLHCNIENNIATVMPGFCCWSDNDTYVYDGNRKINVVNIDNKWYIAGTEKKVQVVSEKSPYTSKTYIHYKKNNILYSNKECTEKCIYISNMWTYEGCKNDIARIFSVCGHCGRCGIAIVKLNDATKNKERNYYLNNLYQEIGLNNYVFIRQKWLVKDNKISKRCDLNNFCRFLVTHEAFAAYCGKIREYYNLSDDNKVIGEEE